MQITVPDDLGRCHLLRHSWLPWTTWFTAAGLDLSEPMETAAFTDSGLLIDAAIAGHGVMLARNVLVADALATGQLVRLFDTAIPFDGAYYFVRPRHDARLTKEIDAFGQWLAVTLQSEFPNKG